jgi:hypothetical protein
MKKVIVLGMFTFISLTSLVAFKPVHNEIKPSISADCKYGRCSQIKSNGEQCKSCRQENSSYCWSHR